MKPAPRELIESLKKHRYQIVGHHSAVKRCRWLYESLIHDRPCYKQKFYGIKSHQCIQMTPSLFYCTQRCLFCWRAQSNDLNISWNESAPLTWDSPEEIVEGCIRAQLNLLSGYKGNLKVDSQKLMEALRPRHAAISLTGEPTLYESISGLIEAFHKRGFTTFLVTNGTVPEALAKLSSEPTQLYISVCAPNKKVHEKVCRPIVPDAWESINKTLELLPSFKCPTVIRITAVRGLNMEPIEDYVRLIEKANPTYIEPKAFMHVGFSRLRLSYDHMPSHREIREFAQKIAESTGYRVIDESVDSRVVLLSSLEKPIKFSNI